MLIADYDNRRVIIMKQRSYAVWHPLVGLLSLALIVLPACTPSSEPESAPTVQEDFRVDVSVTGKLVPASWTTAGTISINGQDMASIRDLDTFRAKTVGFVFQLHNLIPTLNALENVEVPMMGQVRSRSRRRQRATELLRLVGLPARRDHLPSQALRRRAPAGSDRAGPGQRAHGRVGR